MLIQVRCEQGQVAVFSAPDSLSDLSQEDGTVVLASLPPPSHTPMTFQQLSLCVVTELRTILAFALTISATVGKATASSWSKLQTPSYNYTVLRKETRDTCSAQVGWGVKMENCTA